MTDKEFKRYQEAVKIKDQIDNIERDIKYIDDNFNEFGYPRLESGWQLSIFLNNNLNSINLTAELFWECVNLVKLRKYEELKKYKEQFEKL